MDASFFSGNRQRLIEKLGGGLVVLSAYTRLQRSNDSAHYFHQESNFWYLCGINEPDWLLIIDGVQQRSWLVVPDISQTHLTFDGSIDSLVAKKISGVDDVISSDEAMKLLRTCAKRHSMAYTVGQPPYSDHFNFVLNPSIAKNNHMLERIFSRVQDCQNDIAAMRAIKQPEEVKQIQNAVNVTIHAFETVHASMASFKNESEIEAEFTYQLRRGGGSGHAYDPIVASGANACTLHYNRNNSRIAVRELVLMDVGAEVENYAADISRTYMRTNATKRQIKVHEVVQAAHHQIINLITPHLSVSEYQRDVDSIMTEAVKELSLYKNKDSLRRYFPHAVSHGLGIDVHDSLASPKHFKEGMVLTVEPGIYIPEESIGVRIEDDILVTTNGRRNMSGKLSTGL